MNNTLLQYLSELWKFMEYHNRMAPFPPYDTEYVNDIRNQIEIMKKNVEINYDNIPVAACSYCKSLHIQVDEVSNDHCMRCGTVNEITIYNNIDDYLKSKNDDN